MIQKHGYTCVCVCLVRDPALVVRDATLARLAADERSSVKRSRIGHKGSEEP